jgi:hypothetical protein
LEIKALMSCGWDAVQLPALGSSNANALGPAVEQLVHQLVPPPYPSHIPHAGHHPFPVKTVSAANEMVLEGMVGRLCHPLQ